MEEPQEIVARQLEELLRTLRSVSLRDGAGVSWIDATNFCNLLPLKYVREFLDVKTAVLYVDSICEMSDFDSYRNNPRAANFFLSKLKYIPRRRYEIAGHDSDLKEATFKYILKQEAESLANVEIAVDLDGSLNTVTILPWREQMFLAVTDDLKEIVQRRADQNSPWDTRQSAQTSI
jgi:hypothetical protein